MGVGDEDVAGIAGVEGEGWVAVRLDRARRGVHSRATVDDRDHPLRRRYALELALGIALIAAAAWVLLGGGEPEDAGEPSAPRAPAAGR